MTGLPAVGAAWPGGDWSLAFQQYEQNAAWWIGDQAALQALYQGVGNGTITSRGDDPSSHYNRTAGTLRRGGILGWLSRFFVGTPVVDGENRTRLHAPVAANLATLSSDLLFAEPPTFRLLDDRGDVLEGKGQTRLDAILNSEESVLALSDAAELTAAISGTVLTAHWDPKVADRPWIQATPADAALPEFVAGRLSAVNLFTTYHVDDRSRGITVTTYVHIERHEPGAVIHALARLKTNARGDVEVAEYVSLGERPETAHIPTIGGAVLGQPFDQAVTLPTGIQGLTAAWWRNRPTRRYRKLLPMMGRADFEGAEQLLDAVDETWSSWMRDLKIARARLIVPASMLEVQGAGLGGAFDLDRELLTALEYTDLGGENGKISAQQFEIRAEEHANTLRGLTREITQFAGYSMSTYGEQGEAGVTATEVVDRTTLTERTRDRKLRMFATAVRPLASSLLELDAQHFRGPGLSGAADLDIAWPAISQVDPEKDARTYQYLRAAMAISTDAIVRERNPDWNEGQIAREVTRIREENNLGGEPDPALVDRVPGQDPNAADGALDETGTDTGAGLEAQQAAA